MFGQRRIPMTRLSEDARPLTPEEYMRYGHIVGRLRQTTTATATNVSSTGQPLRTFDHARSASLPTAGGSTPPTSRQSSSSSSAHQPHQLLVSAGSSLLRELYRNSSLADRLGRGHRGR